MSSRTRIAILPLSFLFVLATLQGQTCPCSIWSPSTVPQTPDSGDNGAVELGVKFRADVDGYITSIRYYKSLSNLGVHVVNLWSTSGTRLATASTTFESASGWQQVTFANPVPVTANVTYVASYYAPQGHYAYQPNGFATAGVDAPPLHAWRSGVDGGNGVYTYGSSSAFPTSTFNAANYYVDVVFVPRNSTTPPSVLSTSPSSGQTNVAVRPTVRAAFNEPMDSASITPTSFELKDSSQNTIVGSVSYDSASASIVFTPAGDLNTQTTYTALVRAGVKDFFGNALPQDYTWQFTTQAGTPPPPPPPQSGPGGPILVISSSTNPFSRYYGEILLNEGFNAYSIIDVSSVTASTLASYDIAIIGNFSLTSAQVSMLTTWVNGGGRLIAMRPDKQLASLLGLQSTPSTLSNAYLGVNTTTGPGVGIVSDTIQFHGTADVYNLSGATAYASLYSTATASTSNPAVSWVAAGSGQAAAFTYDLARSVVYTRQGNPAWSGQDRDQAIDPAIGNTQIRSNDLFYGPATFDPQPSWIDFNKVQIPQADEQQRLLANLILRMNPKPLPRFWYFPADYKAILLLTGDDHFPGNGWTASRFNQYIQMSTPGCSVANWGCVRATSYVWPNGPIAGYQDLVAAGFEIANHADNSPSCTAFTQSSLTNAVSNQLNQMTAMYPNLAPSVTNRTHCVLWSDYDTKPNVLVGFGIRMDTSYYYWPASWVQDRPGLFTGSGMPMRHTDRNGNLIDVYQVATQIPDETNQRLPSTSDTLFDNAIGPKGFYAVITANMHNDAEPIAVNGIGRGAGQPADAPAGGLGAESEGASTVIMYEGALERGITLDATQWEAVVQSAQSRAVPIVSSRQLLTWLDGRNGSSFGSFTWDGSALQFSINAASGAQRLRALLPANASGQSLTSLTSNGTAVSFTLTTIKGVQYAKFPATSGNYRAVYGSATPAPAVGLSPTTLSFGNQQINTTSAAQVITLTNTGNASLSITGITITGTNPAEFAQTNNCGTSVAAGANCTINVTFTPTTATAKSATLSIADNASGSPHTAALSGTGTSTSAPAVTLSPTSLSFGNQQINTTSAAQAITLSNTGTAALSITGITITGTNPTEFAQTNNCGTSVAAGANCTINVTFTPTTAAARSATLSIADNASGSPHTAALSGTGTSTPTPAVTLSPTSLSFGNQQINTTSAAQAITLSNTGTAALSITSITITGTNPAEFAQTNNCGTSVAAGANCTINVTFTPTTAASRSATLSIADNASGSPHTAALSGTGTSAPAPAVSLSPTSLSFGNQQINTTSAARAITLSNTGTAALSITSITITGTNPTEFAQTNNCGTSVAAGANCTITVTFTPTTAAARSATLSIADNASGSPHTAALSGTGTSAPAPVVSLSPTSLSFGNQQINTTSAARTITLSNTGNAALSLTSIAVTGTNASEFAQTNNCGTSVAAGSNCTISVTFTPTVAATRSAAVSITSNAAGSPHTAALSGTGTTATAPSVTLSPTSLDFGTQPINTISAAQNVTLTNSGTAPLSITSITLTGANRTEFARSHNCGTSVAAGASCRISVTFRPTVQGPRSAALSVASNASGSPHTVALSGIGGPPAPLATVSPTSFNFGRTRVFTTSETRYATLTNTGSADMNVSSIALTGANPAAYRMNTNCPAVLPVGGACNIALNFTPFRTGVLPASVSITTNATGSPHTITLTGQGTN